MLVDSGLFGAEENYAASWVEEHRLVRTSTIRSTSPVTPFVTVEFENRYRCWDNTTDIERDYLQISLDGVNWPDPETLEEEEGYVVVGDDTLAARYEVFPTYERAVTRPTNPTTMARFDIGDVAGDEASVLLPLALGRSTVGLRLDGRRLRGVRHPGQRPPHRRLRQLHRLPDHRPLGGFQVWPSASWPDLRPRCTP